MTPSELMSDQHETDATDGVQVPASTPARADLSASESATHAATEGTTPEPPATPRADTTWPFRILGSCGSAAKWLFGLGSLLVILAALASLPVLQFLSLGYLLEASGRVARSGRLRSGLIGVPKAGRIGSLVLGTWLMLLPLRLISDYWYASFLIDPQSDITQRWRVGLVVCTTLMILHIAAAWYCGGKLRHFFWPLLAPFAIPLWGGRRLLTRLALGSPADVRGRSFSRRLAADLLCAKPLGQWFVPAMLWRGWRPGGMLAQCRDAVWEGFTSLRPRHYFWLGLRGFCGSMAWLFLPVVLLIGATTLPAPASVLSGLVGGLLLMVVVLYLPLLQAQFAMDNRMGAMFELGRIRRGFRRAPIAFWTAMFITLLFALPLYLLMIELTPREVFLLPSLLFVSLILPARLLSGWALARSMRREQSRHFVWRWSARFAALPVAGFYVMIVFFTRYTSWYGVWSLFEQHAFLFPAPFLSL